MFFYIRLVRMDVNVGRDRAGVLNLLMIPDPKWIALIHLDKIIFITSSNTCQYDFQICLWLEFTYVWIDRNGTRKNRHNKISYSFTKAK